MHHIIAIGHSAYDRASANRFFLARSKAAAIRELRERGLTRNAARDAVNDVCTRTHGYKVVRATEYGDPIEINYRTDLMEAEAREAEQRIIASGDPKKIHELFNNV